MVFRRRRMLAPINSIKHIVQRSSVEVSTGGILTVNVVTATAKGGPRGSSNIVEEGAIVKNIHMEYWICPTDQQDTTQFTYVFYKLPSGVDPPDATEMANLSSWVNKKNIFFTSQGVLPAGDDVMSIPVVREWFSIPKGKQRMGLGDNIGVTVFAVGTFRICGVSVYKEYE